MHMSYKNAVTFRILSIGAVLSTLLVGFQNCGTLSTLPGSVTGADDNERAVNPVTAPATNKMPAATRSDLQGAWSQGCTGSAGISERTSVIFEGQALNAQINVYQTGDCAGPRAAQVLIGGSFLTGAASLTVPGATKIHLTAAPSAIVTPYNAKMVNNFNLAGYCGIKTWALNQPQTIPLTAACLNLSGNSLINGTTQIFAVANNALYFGNADNTALDRAAALAKQ